MSVYFNLHALLARDGFDIKSILLCRNCMIFNTIYFRLIDIS